MAARPPAPVDGIRASYEGALRYSTAASARQVPLPQEACRTDLPKTHAHRFRHTFATWAIENDARELDVQYLLGHSTPAMVRRYSATYNAEKAARTHAKWSPGDMLERSLAADPASA